MTFRVFTHAVSRPAGFPVVFGRPLQSCRESARAFSEPGKKGLFAGMLEWGVLLPLRGVPPAEGFSEPGKKGLFAGALEWGVLSSEGQKWGFRAGLQIEFGESFSKF